MLPHYKPEDWIIFTVSGVPHLGKIVGGSVYHADSPSAEWNYVVEMGGEGETQTVVESRITHVFEDGEYRAIT
jgi:hypothetical protein